MTQISLTVFVILLSHCYITSQAFSSSLDKDLTTDPEYREVIDPDNEELRKLLLKKLRFRETLREYMRSPDDLLDSVDEETNAAARHKAAKRETIRNLMSRVQAYIDQVKERQIKESMSLPSLRFGRSGGTWKY